MSLEITLYPKKCSKNALVKFLLDNNFNRSKHFLKSMNSDVMLHFHWFGFDDFESFDGVEATVFKVAEQTKTQQSSSTDWILHTRTRASASYEDKQRQNEIIRKARQTFGGTFYNDGYGTNVYTNLADYRKFSALEKSLSNITTNSLKRLDQITQCLSGYRNETSETLLQGYNNLSEDLKKSIGVSFIQNDPSIVLYNSLMPFLVSVLEFFFGQCFVSYIHYDKIANELLAKEKIKFSVTEVLQIVQKEISLEQIVMQTYNFQNIESINKAYKTFTQFDIRAILSKKKKINGKIFRVMPKIEELLDARHRFVHELDIDYKLTKESYLAYVGTVEQTIRLIIAEFEATGLNIDTDVY